MKKLNINTKELHDYFKDGNLTDKLISNSNSARSLSTHNPIQATTTTNLFRNNASSYENSSFSSEESELEDNDDESTAIRTRAQKKVEETILDIERQNLEDMIEAIETTFKRLNDRATRIEDTARYVNEKQSRVNLEISENLSFITEMRAHVKMLLEKQSRIGRNYPEIQRYVEESSKDFDEYSRVETPPFKPKRQDLYDENDFTDDDEYYGSQNKSNSRDERSDSRESLSKLDDNEYYDSHEKSNNLNLNENDDYKNDAENIDNNDSIEYEEIRLNPLKTDDIHDDNEPIERASDSNSLAQPASDDENPVNNEDEEKEYSTNELVNGEIDDVSKNESFPVDDENLDEKLKDEEIENYSDEEKSVPPQYQNGECSDHESALPSMEENHATPTEECRRTPPMEKGESFERGIDEELTEEERLIVERLKLRLLEEEQYEETRKNGHAVESDEMARAKAMAALKELEEA